MMTIMQTTTDMVSIVDVNMEALEGECGVVWISVTATDVELYWGELVGISNIVVTDMIFCVDVG